MGEEDIWAQMGLPMGFGKRPAEKKMNIAARIDNTRRIPGGKEAPSLPSREVEDDHYKTSSTSAAPHVQDMPPILPVGPSASHALPSDRTDPPSEDEEDDPNDDDEDGADWATDNAESDVFPITHEITLKDHSKVVSALALDPPGARVASGSHDYECKLWDFGGMNASLKPFKSWEPAGSYHIHELKYSNAGDYVLVIPGTTQPMIYDRDGQNNDTFAKGDPYIRDMRHTDGHVGEMTSGAWHPKDPNTFITSSNDSTIRIWDVENKRKQKTVIVVKSKERGTRTKITACSYNTDGKMIAGAGLDGTIHLWSTSGTYARPSSTVEGAHMKGAETGSLVFSHDGHTLVSRGGDGTVKLWDARAFKKPVVASPVPLPSFYPETNAVFSPDERYIACGRSAEGRGDRGALVILQRDTLEVQRSVECDPGVSVVRIVWHGKINQIVTGLSNGQINVLYSPHASLNGAKLLLTKSAKKVTIEDASRAFFSQPIITPHALPMFREDDPMAALQSGREGRVGKRKREKERMDKRKTQRPDAPLSGPGRGGRVGASATQHVVQNLVRDSTRDEDPREALLKYANTEADPLWTKAWKDQPKVFSSVQEPEEEENE